MNKKTKGCLMILIIFVAIVTIIICFIYYNLITSKERENNDIIQCEKTQFISESPLIILEKNSEDVIHHIIVSLQRNYTIIKHIVVKKNIQNETNYFSFNIPFKKFKKTDVIIIDTEHGKYKISNFNYSLKSRWLMFGYNGGECSLDYYKLKINDQYYNGDLLREKENEKNKILLQKK